MLCFHLDCNQSDLSHKMQVKSRIEAGYKYLHYPNHFAIVTIFRGFRLSLSAVPVEQNVAEMSISSFANRMLRFVYYSRLIIVMFQLRKILKESLGKDHISICYINGMPQFNYPCSEYIFTTMDSTQYNKKGLEYEFMYIGVVLSELLFMNKYGTNFSYKISIWQLQIIQFCNG